MHFTIGRLAKISHKQMIIIEIKKEDAHKKNTTYMLYIKRTYTKENRRAEAVAGPTPGWTDLCGGRVLLQQNDKISPNSNTFLDGRVLFWIAFFSQKPVYQFIFKHINGRPRFSHFTWQDVWFGNHKGYVNARFHLVATKNKFCFW